MGRRRMWVGGWVGGGPRGEDVNSSSTRSDPYRPERPSATARATMLRRWGPRQCEATCTLLYIIAVSPAVRSKVTKTMSKKQQPSSTSLLLISSGLSTQGQHMLSLSLSLYIYTHTDQNKPLGRNLFRLGTVFHTVPMPSPLHPTSTSTSTPR